MTTIKMFILNNLIEETNGKTSSRIHRKLGKYNELLQQFSGDHLTN
ncbi:MAG: hypothetical protein ACLU22_00975 [Clostridium sp.]